jgi:hypothetical protein
MAKGAGVRCCGSCASETVALNRECVRSVSKEKHCFVGATRSRSRSTRFEEKSILGAEIEQ